MNFYIFLHICFFLPTWTLYFLTHVFCNQPELDIFLLMCFLASLNFIFSFTCVLWPAWTWYLLTHAFCNQSELYIFWHMFCNQPECLCLLTHVSYNQPELYIFSLWSDYPGDSYYFRETFYLKKMEDRPWETKTSTTAMHADLLRYAFLINFKELFY